MEQSLSRNPRIEVVDALRGFAVMAILLVHNLEHFIFPVYPADPPEWLHVLDLGVFNTVFTLFAGKSYAIFALLFGLYLAPYCGYAASLLIGIGVFMLQVWFCKWWLGRHKQGPLESIWHKWTWIGTGK